MLTLEKYYAAVEKCIGEGREEEEEEELSWVSPLTLELFEG